jgi:hypothetical protein
MNTYRRPIVPESSSSVQTLCSRLLSTFVLAFFISVNILFPLAPLYAQVTSSSTDFSSDAVTSSLQSTSTTESLPIVFQELSEAVESAQAPVIATSSLASNSPVTATAPIIDDFVDDWKKLKQEYKLYLEEQKKQEEISKAEIRKLREDLKDKLKEFKDQSIQSAEVEKLEAKRKKEEKTHKGKGQLVEFRDVKKNKKIVPLTKEEIEAKVAALRAEKEAKKKKGLAIDGTALLESLSEANAQLSEQYSQKLEENFTEEEINSGMLPSAPVVFAIDEYEFNDILLEAQIEVGMQIEAASDASSVSTPVVLTRPIIVAVIDAGVDMTHEDLQGRMWRSDICASDEGVRLPQSCEGGYDFVQDDFTPTPTDGSDHGTGVASIIAASTNNGMGMSSLSMNRAKIMSLKVAEGGFIVSSNLVRAIYFAAYNGADIINMSLSGPAFNQELADAIAYAQSMGIVVVASAGNAGINIDETPVYPAVLPGVIAVGAADSSKSVASWSNYGERVDVIAPGVAITMASLSNTYRTNSGTSFSAPLTTALFVKEMSEGKNIAEFIATLPINQNFAGKAKQARVLPMVEYLDGIPLEKADNYTFVNGSYVTNDTKEGTFTLAATDPTLNTPSLNSPGSGASNYSEIVSQTSSLRFSWSKVTGAKQYGLYVTNVTTGTSQYYENLGDVSSKSLSGLTVGHKYRWNVAASKTNTISGLYNVSGKYYFTYGASAPTAPVAPTVSANTSSPGASVAGTAFTATWNSVSGATSYLLHVRDLYTNALIVDSRSITSSASTVNGLVAGHSYRYNVQAVNIAGVSSVSNYGYFYVPATVAAIPNVPTGITPQVTSAPGTLVNGSSLTVSWASNGAAVYNVAWSKKLANGSYELLPGGDVYVSGTSHTITNLQPGTQYRFDIAAGNSAGKYSARSGNSYFYTSGVANNTPSVPVISGQQSINVGSSQTFTFSSVDADSDLFKIQVDWDAATASLIDIESESVGQSTSISKKYINTGSYCIKARAVDVKGATSAWSSCYPVTVSALQLPDLEVTSMTVSSKTVSAGDSLDVVWSIRNNGNTPVAKGKTMTTRFYVSPESVQVSKTGTALASSHTYTFASDLPVGGSLTGLTSRVTLPSKGDVRYSSLTSRYNLSVSIDDSNTVAEIREDNIRAIAGSDYQVLVINSTQSSANISIDSISGNKNVGSAFTITVRTDSADSKFKNANFRVTADGYSVTGGASALVNGVKSQSITLGNGITGQARLSVELYDKVSGATLARTMSNEFSVSSSLSSNGKATVIVKDTTGAFANKTVQLGCVIPDLTTACPLTDFVTDAKGSFSFNVNSVLQGRSGQVFVQAAIGDTIYKSKKVSVSPTTATVQEIKLSLKDDLTHRPVILVPGIMGSTMKGEFRIFPGLDSGNPKASEIQPWGNFIVWETLGQGFGSIKKLLTSSAYGYIEGQTLFECAYDWRDVALDNADNYLKDCIDNALAQSPRDGVEQDGKVDIVAHSMGGLVSRTLVQSDPEYAKKVKTIVFVGTPQRGAAMAYPVWEGGDLGVDPPINVVGGISTFARNSIVYQDIKDIYTNIEADSNEVPIYEDATRLSIPEIVTQGMFATLVGGTSLLRTVTEQTDYEKELVKSFIRKNVPSLRELMPTYTQSLTSESGITLEIECHENRFLKALNGEVIRNHTCYKGRGYVDQNDPNYWTSGNNANGGNIVPLEQVTQANNIDLAMFYGGDASRNLSEWTSQDRADQGSWTRRQFAVGNPTQVIGINEDGKLSGSYESKVGASSGDGTVPIDSSYKFAKTKGSGVFKYTKGLTGDHGTLVNLFKTDIANYLTKQTFVPDELNAITNRLLRITVSGQVRTSITDSGGNITGVSEATQTGVNSAQKIANFEIGENGAEYDISEVTTEDFKLTLFDGSPGEVLIGLMYSELGTPVIKEYPLYYPGGKVVYTVSVDPDAVQSNDSIKINSIEHGVTALKVAKTQDGKSSLSWSPSTGLSAIKYRIYSIALGTGWSILLGETSATTFATNISWPSSTNAVRIYRVAPVFAAGNEGVLSEPVMDNDQDEDKISDFIEVTIGTNPAIADTDGDGRDDAQEYYVDKTNPLVIDAIANNDAPATETLLTNNSVGTQAYGNKPFSLAAVFSDEGRVNSYSTIVAGTDIGPRRFAHVSMQSDGRLHAEIAFQNASGANVSNEFVTTQTYKDGNKHYVELVAKNASATTSELSLYVDGVKVKTQAIAATYNYPLPFAKYTLGSFVLYTNGSSHHNFAGKVYKAMTFYGNRTATEITQRSAQELALPPQIDVPASITIGSPIIDGQGTTTALGTQAFSIGSWFTASTTGSYGVLASGAKGDNSRNFLALWYTNTGLVGGELGSNVNFETYSTSSLADGRKHYVEFAVKQGAGQSTGTLYIDGVQASTVVRSGLYTVPVYARWQLGEFTNLGPSGTAHQFSGVRGEAHGAHIIRGERTSVDIKNYYQNMIAPPVPEVVVTPVTDKVTISSTIGSKTFGIGSWFKSGAVSQESALVGATHLGERSFTVLKLRPDGKIVAEFAYVAGAITRGVEVESTDSYTNNMLHYAEMKVKNTAYGVEVTLYVDGAQVATQSGEGAYTLREYDEWNTKRMRNWSSPASEYYNMAYGGVVGAQYFYDGERNLAHVAATFASGNSVQLAEYSLDSVPLDNAPIATTTESVSENPTPVDNTEVIQTSESSVSQ